MNFSLNDYKANIASDQFLIPKTFCPYMNVNIAEYRKLENAHETNNNNIGRAFRELKQRVSQDYFRNIYPIQTRALDYSQISFPAYRFILPEVIANDWHAMVGWHKYNRDHIVHQPLTAYIVQKLLNDKNNNGDVFKLNNGKTFLEACVDEILEWKKTSYIKDFLLNIGFSTSDTFLTDSPNNKYVWKLLFKEAAFLAAMFHDIGYPWQYLNHISKCLESSKYISASPTFDAEKIIETFGDRMLLCPFNGYKFHDRNAPSTWRQRLLEQVSKALKNTHGLPGAIGFLYLNDILRDYPTNCTHPIGQFCVEWASMAIMMHDMLKIYWGKESYPENPHLQLCFEVDPLSSIITLADIIEDFSRPTPTFNENGNHVDIAYDNGCDCAELMIMPNKVLKIDYFYENPKNYLTKKYYLMKDRKYFNNINGYLNLSKAGINSIEMDAHLCDQHCLKSKHLHKRLPQPL